MTDTGRQLALVTGATSGIGLEFARQLAERGLDLLLVARDRVRLDTVAHELSAASRAQVQVLAADLATDAGIDIVAQQLTASPVDVLVNNAGFGTKGFLHKTDPASQHAMVRLHVVATNRLTVTTLPAMVARGRGAVITVSSVASFVASAANANYTATKAYQRVFMESLALELKGTGVYAQALCPGFVRTQFHDRAAMRMEGIPAFLWLDVRAVVAAALSAMDRGGPVVVIPSRRWQCIVWLLRHLPQRLLRLGARRYQKTRT
ncbi:MAG: SDR family NAD(P)-dependent oxidoreductase [Gemmatimonadaceae bacterium]